MGAMKDQQWDAKKDRKKQEGQPDAAITAQNPTEKKNSSKRKLQKATQANTTGKKGTGRSVQQKHPCKEEELGPLALKNSTRVRTSPTDRQGDATGKQGNRMDGHVKRQKQEEKKNEGGVQREKEMGKPNGNKTTNGRGKK